MLRNAICLSLDALRFDVPSSQPEQRILQARGGDGKFQTPTLDSLCRRGRYFPEAVSVSTYTTSAHASVLTGLYPPHHGVRAFYKTRLAEVPTLPEILREQGFLTVLATDVPDLWEPLDLTRGFERVFARDDGGLFDFLREEGKQRRVFLLAHFFDVHMPYLYSECPPRDGYNAEYWERMVGICTTLGIRGPEGFEGRPHDLMLHVVDHMGNRVDFATFFPLYLAGVEKFDRGRFAFFLEGLQDAGLLEDGLLTVFSDHGEGRYGEHLGHMGSLTEEVLRVFLNISGPGITPARVDAAVSLVDLFPTVLGALDVPVPVGIDGRDLLHGDTEGTAPHYAEVWAADGPMCQRDGGAGMSTFVPPGLSWRLMECCLRREGRKELVRWGGESCSAWTLNPTTDPLEELPQGGDPGEESFQELVTRSRSGVETTPIFPAVPAQRQVPVELLEGKCRHSRAVIRRALDRFGEDLAVAFTGGKDSLVLLSLVREEAGGRVPGAVVHVDTGVKFPEVYDFRDRISREWDLPLRVVRNEEAMREIQIAADHAECCRRLKVEPLQRAIVEYGWRALLVAVRWDEHPARSRERSVSSRGDHVRVHPLLAWTEEEIWAYIRSRGLPYCPLYDRGYRSLGCLPCTQPSTEGERAGRSQDKEGILASLRRWGYF